MKRYVAILTRFILIGLMSFVLVLILPRPISDSDKSAPKRTETVSPSSTPDPVKMDGTSKDEPSKDETSKGVNCLNPEEQEHNEAILKNLLQFQELASYYHKTSGDSERFEEQSTALLMASFIRVSEERYRDAAWMALAGNSEEFETFVKESEDNQCAIFLSESEYLYDPTTGEKIDWIHLMATLNVYLYQTVMYQIYPETGDVGGWAGDCIQLAKEAKEEQVDAANLEGFMEGRLGVSGAFGMADVLANLDALNIYEEVEEDEDLYTVLEEYYHSMDEATRYQKFITNRFPTATTKRELKEQVRKMVAGESTLVIDKVCARVGLEDKDRVLRESAGDCFTDFVWEHCERP